jgi:two-component system LytT family response regulator
VSSHRIRTLIVDDEPLARAMLRSFLAEDAEIEVIGECGDGYTAIEMIESAAPDLVFLDIQMPDLDGFGVLRALEPSAIPNIAFVTAYDQFALKAFEVNAIDYLLKPIEPEQLDRAIGKLDRMRGAPRPDLRSIVEQVAASLTRPEPDRIATRTGERIQFIDLARVTHFFAQDKLTYAAAGGRSYSVDYTIAELEERLARKNFVRIHRSTLVNVAWVQEMDAWFGGGVLVRLRDDKHTELQVARDRVRALKERLGV